MEYIMGRYYYACLWFVRDVVNCFREVTGRGGIGGRGDTSTVRILLRPLSSRAPIQPLYIPRSNGTIGKGWEIMLTGNVSLLLGRGGIAYRGGRHFFIPWPSAVDSMIT